MKLFFRHTFKIFFRGMTCIFLLFLMFSCTSIQEGGGQTYVPLNYSESDVIENELNSINLLKEDECVKALWRLENLLLKTDSAYVKKIKEECKIREEQIFNLCQKAILENKYYDALSYYDTLCAFDYEKINELKINGREISERLINSTPGFNDDYKKFAGEKKVSQFIRGTVTVFVDKGIKIEHGVGRADAVLGSGFFISKNGYVITNHHVISDMVDPKYEGFSRLYIRLADDPDTRIPAKVIGYDSILDLALLKAEVEAPYVFKLGTSQGLDVGDKVYAIGSPLGLEKTLTSGIVSSIDRKLLTLGNVFQIDAAVNSGNSGGPLIDQDGSVQAVVFAGVQNYQGLNFAIPVEYLKLILPSLFNGGQTEHCWIASYGKTKKSSGIPSINEGLEVQYVMPGGSACLSGIKAGDVITAIDDVEIKNLEAFQTCLMVKKTDSVCRIKILNKDGISETKLVYLEKRPQNPGYEIYNHDVIALSFLPITGMELTPLSTSSKRKYSVAKVLKGSIADETGFSEHDPVDLLKVEFNEEKTAMYVQLYTKKRKNGFMDMSIGFAAPLDSPYYY